MVPRIASATALGVVIATLISWPAAAQDASVLTYHGDGQRSGHYVVPGLTWDHATATHLDTAFRAQVAGHVYAQPLYWRASASGAGVLIVATEDDNVYALNAETGAEVWKRNVGSPAPHRILPCGNIDPLGITGTPVIDSASQAVYLDAVTATSGSASVQHQIFALSLKDGSILRGWPVTVSNVLKTKGGQFIPANHNQRGALLVQGGVVYVPYSGHWGDCEEYHGWVVGVPLHDPSRIQSWSTRAKAGGIWAQGGVASDGQALYVGTGNTMGVTTWGDGEAVIRLLPGLAAPKESRDYFVPANWYDLDKRDADIGSSGPLLFDLRTGAAPAPRILALGKDGFAYLINRSDLGGIGGQLSAVHIADKPIRTSPAAWPTRTGVMVAFQGVGAACPNPASRSGVIAIEIQANAPAQSALRTAWCSTLSGAGAPIVTTSDGSANPIVWIVGAEGDNRLHAFRGDTGAELTLNADATPPMQGLHHFQTILAAHRRLYVAADGRVYTFAF